MSTLARVLPRVRPGRALYLQEGRFRLIFAVSLGAMACAAANRAANGQPGPPAACCLADGSCLMVPHNACVLQGGDPLGPGADCAALPTPCSPLKWSQPPMFNPISPHPECFWGWDEPSWYGGFQIVADDWRCETAQPITDIHFWGSYDSWTGIDPPVNAPATFHIGLWTDVPFMPPGFSHPGVMIWDWYVSRTQLNEHPVACDFQPDQMTSPEGCFRYDFTIPEPQWFYQEPGCNVYWISISEMYPVCACDADVNGDGLIGAVDLAILMNCVGQPPIGQCARADINCDGVINAADVAAWHCRFGGGPPAQCCPQSTPLNIWGWKTREHFFMDDAVKITSPTAPIRGMGYGSGTPIEDLQGESWDMAFTITTSPACRPMTDGSACMLTICPIQPEECVPVEVTCPVSGLPCVISDCNCQPGGDCHVDLGPGGTPMCAGGCPLGYMCISVILPQPNGSTIYKCTCAPQPEACCFPDGHCEMQLAADCLLIDGTPMGPGTSCLGDNSGDGIDDACETLDHVVCEPQGGNNPTHPSVYWYDVTPQGWGRCDFHVLLLDPNPGNYSNSSITPLPPDGNGDGIVEWLFSVHQLPNGEWWASWYTPNCHDPLTAGTTYRLQFNHNGANAWSHWRTTYTGNNDPYDPLTFDRSQNHPGEPDGYGYRVHVPTPPVVTQACCLKEGTCTEVEYNKCVALGGDPQGPDTICDLRVCNPIKWAQPPTYGVAAPGAQCFWGWDEPSHYQCCQIAADDWVCDSKQPITDIHWWGSYQNWTTHSAPPIGPGFPDFFHIGIWKDIPANVDRPFSHPGTMITQWIVPRQQTNEHWVGCDSYPGMPADTCFRYDFDIPESQWFYQAASTTPTVYWISISAWYMSGPPQQPFVWGWKTRDHFFGDDAVRILAPNAPIPGMNFIDGLPITSPDGVSWDMAFVLTTLRPSGVKWEQWPDTTLPGLHAHDGITLADDWECQGGKVTDFHWWGNYELDDQGNEIRGAGLNCINISIHTTRPTPECVPQDPALWGVCAFFDALHETWTGLLNNEGSRIYKYDFVLQPGFAQSIGQTYWLDLEGTPADPLRPALWRWQEAGRTATPRLCGAAERTPSMAWHTIVWPDDPPQFSEMAFIVTSHPFPPTPDTSGVDKNRYISFMVGNGGEQTALRVTLASLHHPNPPNLPQYPPLDYSAFEGEVRYVGPVSNCRETEGPPETFFNCARLQCDPYYTDWQTATGGAVLHVTAAEIVPSSFYDVEVLSQTCAGLESVCAGASVPLRIGTTRWGDVGGPFQLPCQCTLSGERCLTNADCTAGTCNCPSLSQPNISDVAAVVDKFKEVSSAIILARADVNPSVPNGRVDIADVANIVDGFKNLAYAFGGPCACPSAAPCPTLDACGRCHP